jgi:hypothetical protein
MDVSLHVQVEKTFSPNTTRDYSGITTAGTPIANLYLGRIYSSTWGWSQVGGPTDDVQYIDWTTGVNTSAWDGTGPITTGSVRLMNGLRIHDPGILQVQPGAYVTCSGNTEINTVNGLQVQSTASGTGSFIDNGNIVYNSGSAMVQQYLMSDMWHGFCIPLTTIKTLPFHKLYMKWYSEPEHHYRYVIDNPLDSDLVTPGKGYMMYSDNASTGDATVNQTGVLNTGLITIPVTGTTGTPHDGWNLVGNPYPSALDWESASVILPVQVSPTYYVWKPGDGNYGTYNRQSHTGTLGINQYIAPEQGFFIEVLTAYTGTYSISFNNGARTHNLVSFYKGTQQDLLTLSIDGNDFSDEAKVWFNMGAAAGFEGDWDNHKLTGDDAAPQIWFPLPDGELASVNTLPWTGVNTIVPLSYKMGAQGTSTLTVSTIESFRYGTHILLEDKRDNAWQDLVANPVYSFTSSPADATDRFVLHFTNPYFGVDEHASDGVQIYSFESNLYVRNVTPTINLGDLFMYDLMGRLVFQDKLQNTLINKYIPGVNEGYYVVRVVTPDHVYTQKIYLN